MFQTASVEVIKLNLRQPYNSVGQIPHSTGHKANLLGQQNSIPTMRLVEQHVFFETQQAEISQGVDDCDGETKRRIGVFSCFAVGDRWVHETGLERFLTQCLIQA